MIIYVCSFEWENNTGLSDVGACPNLPKYVLRKVEAEGGPSMFSDGFWVNGALEYTKGSDCRVWIPPSRIICIEKIGGSL